LDCFERKEIKVDNRSRFHTFLESNWTASSFRHTTNDQESELISSTRASTTSSVLSITPNRLTVSGDKILRSRLHRSCHRAFCHANLGGVVLVRSGAV